MRIQEGDILLAPTNWIAAKKESSGTAWVSDEMPRRYPIQTLNKEVTLRQLEENPSLKYITSFEYCGWDETRPGSKYLVTSARMAGGSNNASDYYPNGWQVTAKRLKDDEYDWDGEVVMFYQSGQNGSANFYMLSNPEIVGRMKKVVKWIHVTKES